MATEEARGVESGSIASQPPDAAFQEAARVVREEPSSDEHWDALEGWAADRQQPDAVSRLYREVLGRSLVGELAASLGQRAVAFHEEWFGEDSAALLEVLRRVLELDPEAADWAFSRLTVAYTSSERWEELLSLYDGEIARATDEARRVSLLDEAAQSAKDFAGAPDRAIGYLTELVRLRPDDLGQVRNLERLLERKERWLDLVSLLRERMTRMDAAEAHATRLAIAHMYLDKTRSYAEALIELRSLLDETETDTAPAVSLLERIVADQEAPDSTRREAISLLRERYTLEERTTDVVRTLDTALEFADRGEQIVLHAEAAERLSEQGQHAEAMDHYAQMLRLSPADEKARARLRALADRSSAHARFVEILEQTANELSDGAVRARLRVEAAEVRRAVLGDVEGAITLYNQVLDEPLRGAELALVAARNLAELYAAVGRRNSRLVMLEAQAGLEPEMSSRQAVLRKVAELATELGEADRALAAYQRLLRESPEDARALESMIALLEAEARWPALIDALRRRIATTPGAWQTRADLVRVAHVQSERLDEVDAAIATWKEVAERFGEDADVVDALSALYTRTERWPSLAELLSRAAAREGEHLAAVRVRLGDTYRDRLGAPERAVTAYRQAIEASAADEGARAGLATLTEDPGVRAEAVEGLARSYMTTDEWEPLLALLPQRLAAAANDAAKVALLREAADLEERRADAKTAALASIGKAFALRPSDERLEADLHRLGELTGSFAEVADALAAAADRLDGDPHREAYLRATQARILEEKLERVDEAFDAYRRAFGAQPQQEALGRAVVRLAGATGRWSDAEASLAAAAADDTASDDILRCYAEVQRRSPGPAFFETLCRLSDRIPSDLDPLVEALAVAKAHLGDEALVTDTVRRLYERAGALFQRGSRATGEHAAPEVATSALIELVDRLERGGDLRAAMARLIEGARLPVDPATSAAWKRRAAAIAAGPAGDRAVAIDLYRDALTSSPTDVEAPRALGDLLEVEGRLPELLALRKIELARCEDPERRLELRLSIAELVAAIEALGGRVEALKANLTERPGHAASIDAMIGVLTAQHRFAELADVLTAQAEALDGPAAARLWSKVAELAEGELGDVERALGAYRRVVSLHTTPGALDALARISASRDDHGMASFWLERRLAMADESEHTDLSLTLASALKAAGRHDRVPAVLEQARARNPKRADLRTMLAEEYRAAKAFEPLAALLSESIEHADDAAQVLAIVREAVELYEGVLHEPEHAIPLMRRGIELSPDDLGMRMKLADALRAVGRLDEAREVLTELIEGFGRRRSAERAQVHYLLGRVAHAQGDLDGALAQLDLATKMDMQNAPMLLTLGRIAREAEQLDRAEKAYRTLLMIVRRRSPADPVEVGLGEVLFELHAIAKAHGDGDKAGELLGSALEAAGQSEPEALRFAEALASRGEPEFAVKGIERRLALAESPLEKAKLLTTLADVLAGPLGRPGEALGRRLEALRMVPEDGALHDAARALAKSEGASSKYVDLVRELVEAHRRKDDASKVTALLLLAGRALEEDLGDLDAAADHFVRAEALAEGAARVQARLALVRLYAVKGDRAAQRRIYEVLVNDESVDEAERIELTYRLAQVELDDPETLDPGLVTLRRAYEQEPRHASVCAILAGAIARGASSPALLALYEQVARAAGDDALLLDFLEHRATLPGASSATLREAAECALACGAVDRAERALEALVALADQGGAPEDELRFAVLELAARRESAGDPSGAIRWLDRAVAMAIDPDERRALRLRLAHLATCDGGDLRAAAEAYRALLEEDGNERAVWEPLLDVYARLGDESGLSDLVATLVDALLEPAERNVPRLVKARFLMTLEGRSPDAIDVLTAMLDDEPEHAEAGDLLAALYEKIGYDEDLVALLERQLDVARDTQDREKIVELSLKLGGLLREVRREDAMDVYRRALDWVPEERIIITSLLDLFGPDHDPHERIEVRERLLATEEGDAASRLALELHAAWVEEGDAEGAERVLGLGYNANPVDAEIRGRLEALYRANDDAERLAAFLARDAERVRGDAAAFRERVFEAARLYRDRLGRPTQAAEVLRVTMGEHRDIEVLDELVQCLETADQPDAAVDEVTSALEAHVGADAVRVALLRMRARLRLGQGHVDLAVEDLEAAHTIDPRATSSDLVACLVKARADAEHRGDRERHRELSLRLVGVLEAAGEKAQARDVLASWVRVDPSDVEALAWLRDVDVATENWPGVIFACSHLIDAAHDEEQVRAAMLLADATEATGDIDAAREALERVHRAQPEHPAILARLKAAYERAGAHRDLAVILLAEARTMDEDARFAAYRRAGELLITQVGDLDAALPPLEAAHQIRPDDHESTILLVDVYTQLGQHADAGQLIETAIANHPKRRSPELSQLQHRMARLARYSGDRQLDLQWMNAALECDKNNMDVAAEIAELAMALGDHDTALNALRAITLSRVEGPMSRAMAFLLQARIAFHRGEARRALLWARKAKSEDPQLTAATDFLKELGES